MQLKKAYLHAYGTMVYINPVFLVALVAPLKNRTFRTELRGRKECIELHTKTCYIDSVESRAEMLRLFLFSFLFLSCARRFGRPARMGRATPQPWRDPGMNQKQFYKRKPWLRARQAYIDKRQAIDGGLCELCHEEPGYIVHHYKVWLDDINCNDPEIALNEDNFQYVCLVCHNKEKDPRLATPGRCRYGPNGEIIRNSAY